MKFQPTPKEDKSRSLEERNVYFNTPNLLRVSLPKNFAAQRTSKYIMMVNILSIIIVILSLFRSLISADFTGWISNYIELIKKRDAAAQSYKYHGLLILSAYDLQLRLIDLLENLLAHIHDQDAKDSQIAIAEIMTVKDEDGEYSC
ncbi:c8655a36-6c35-4230-bcd4-7e0b8f088d11-CDS [Sclerotinia trifoliorum]|uniref:C8655a36-6c35-4230-bcd4-7e0b8f088d11-CDS n=1 Tax=Sclerotinia trifoliorum TaxID=28548 RepID=A0A8H2VTB0_9HELO|nr:c8655a36-6c35-4230-bcd4-7e0b8f088d11-CDS [Sclerotinia trifoliorum]